MIDLDRFDLTKEHQHAVLPPDHPYMWSQTINQPIFDQDLQWRLKIQPFTKGGFEAKAVLVNRNALNRLVNANRDRGLRTVSKERDEADILRDREKAAFRAARKVRHFAIEIRADRLLTLTSRGLLTDYDQVIATWKRFMRVLDAADSKFDYIAVPELHKSGEHYHIHAAINGFVKADLLRRCWQIALGGKGNERGSEALGNVDLKQQKRRAIDPIKQTVGIARYISKYITKSYLEHHQFNRKRYWVPRSIKLPESSGEWMRAETLAEAVQELYIRFDPALMIEATKDQSLFITDRNAAMIFFRYLPSEINTLTTPF
ncbi:MAG: hypothetical protein V4629_06660 [Pseudomonadota bacterium]